MVRLLVTRLPDDDDDDDDGDDDDSCVTKKSRYVSLNAVSICFPKIRGANCNWVCCAHPALVSFVPRWLSIHQCTISPRETLLLKFYPNFCHTNNALVDKFMAFWNATVSKSSLKKRKKSVTRWFAVFVVTGCVLALAGRHLIKLERLNYFKLAFHLSISWRICNNCRRQ